RRANATAEVRQEAFVGADRSDPPLDRAGSEVVGALVVNSAGAAHNAGGSQRAMGAQPDRCVYLRPAGAGKSATNRGGGQGNAAAPAQPRCDRSFTHDRGSRSVPGGPEPGRLREAGGAALAVAPLRRALGPALARR